MKRKATKIDKVKASTHAARFAPALDSRKRKVRGLVTRNGRYYAQMRVALPSGESRAVRIALEATRLDLAIAEAEKARTEKRSGEIHLPGKRPLFKELSQQYRQSGIFAQKKTSTQQDETQSLKMWDAYLGGTRVDRIEPSRLSAFMEERLKAGRHPRTINKNLSAFNNTMRFGKSLPGSPVKAIPQVDRLAQRKPKKRPRLSSAQIAHLLEHAPASKNAELMRFYIRFLAASGCREQEALSIRKSAVDTKREVVTIGSEGEAKNSLSREIQFNSTLGKVLTELLKDLPPDCSWLFPSPQRGEKDMPAKSLRESFYAIRDAAMEADAELWNPWREWNSIPKSTKLGFHDLRHYFASQCVMGGIDYMTIAEWLGHQDGGILVGKTYGHLNDEHKRKAAKKLTF
ncbi:MAG: tyrosine-type recombinase/integrase [bacterium]